MGTYNLINDIGIPAAIRRRLETGNNAIVEAQRALPRGTKIGDWDVLSDGEGAVHAIIDKEALEV